MSPPESTPRRRALVLCLSRTGASARLAREAARHLRAGGCQALLLPLVPRVALPYLGWLILSLIPATRIPTTPLGVDPAAFDLLVLAFPKWAHTCPPVESFLARHRGRLPPTALLVSCGGWDQDRYLARYRRKVAAAGAPVAGAAAARRDEIAKNGAAEKVAAALSQELPLELP